MDNKKINAVGIIIENNENKILLQLRDSNTDRFPNCWVLLGGAIKHNESPEKAIIREIKEEIDFNLKDFDFFGNFFYNKDNQAFFYKKIDLDLKKINLTEGKEIRFFSEEEIKNINFGFNIKEVVNAFLVNRREKNESD
ncbi:MAG: NUDIX domain-containing protein [Candidatus Pacearchaeota archaeon]|jgi:8-oxo-dGTP diphosphatase